MFRHPASISIEHGYVEIDIPNNRVVHTTNNKIIDDILNTDFFKNGCGKYWINTKKIGDNKYEAEYINHIIRYPEFTPEQFLESLYFLHDVCVYCRDNGYFIRTHLWNVVYYRGRPLIIDIRDFEHLYHQNWINIFRNHFKKRDELDGHCPVDVNLFISNYDEVLRAWDKCSNALGCILEVLDVIKLVERKKEVWSNYHHDRTNFLYNNNNLLENIKNYGGGSGDNRKSKNLLDEINIINPKTVIEVGCNNGLYCFGTSLLNNNISVLGVDYDLEAINTANNINKKLNLICIFIRVDLLDLDKLNVKYGLNGSYGSLLDRSRSELLIAPSIIHHLFNASKSLDKIIDIFDKLASKNMIIEHIDGYYGGVNDLIYVLNKYKWNIDKMISSSPEPRLYLICSKKKDLLL
jgi:hypothetical protein